MDLLLFVVRGVSVVANSLRVKEQIVDSKVDGYIVDALFSTITNANFDDESILKRVDNGLQIRQKLISQAEKAGIDLPSVDEVVWDGQRSEYEGKAKSVGVLREPNEDIRSLKELTVYGLKGMAAYLEHERVELHPIFFRQLLILFDMENDVAQVIFQSLIGIIQKQ